MATVSNLKAGLDKKIWQQMAPSPTTNATSMFVINDPNSWDPEIMYVTSATAELMYNTQQDAWINLPSSAIAGTFGACACGTFQYAGPTGTATAGTTTTITTALTINRSLAGMIVRITGGTNAGQDRIIKSNTIGANSVITVLDAFSGAIDNTSVYLLMTGRYYFFNPSTTAPGFRYYDRATNAWTALSVTGLATSWGTDARMVTSGYRNGYDLTPPTGLPVTSSTSTVVTTGQNFVVNQFVNRMIFIISGTGVGQYRQITSNTANTITVGTAFSTTPDSTSKYIITGLSTGTATSGGAGVLNDTTKAWTASQFINMQIRIVSGTGAGQVRVITANTATQISVASWATNPDNTSVYIIEGDQNAIYLLGNNAVTMYKYSISGDTWTTLAPGVARAAAPGAGMSANIIMESTDSAWTTDTAIINGRRMYSLRGGATATMDYYDIPSNAWTNGITYLPQTETFTTGSGFDAGNGGVYCSKDATGRIFLFDPAKGTMTPISTLVFPDSTATLGDKLFSWTYVDGDTKLMFLYRLSETLTNLFRVLIY